MCHWRLQLHPIAVSRYATQVSGNPVPLEGRAHCCRHLCGHRCSCRHLGNHIAPGHLMNRRAVGYLVRHVIFDRRGRRRWHLCHAAARHLRHFEVFVIFVVAQRGQIVGRRVLTGRQWYTSHGMTYASCVLPQASSPVAKPHLLIGQLNGEIFSPRTMSCLP